MPGWKCSASCMPTPHEGQALPTKSDWEPYVCSSCVHVQAYHISMFGAPRYENFPARSGGKPLSHGCEHGGASDFRDRAGLVRRIAGCLLGPVERKTPSQQYRSSVYMPVHMYKHTWTDLVIRCPCNVFSRTSACVRFHLSQPLAASGTSWRLPRLPRALHSPQQCLRNEA